MSLPRRDFLRLATSAAALSASPSLSWAAGYPARPVRIIEGFGGTGAPDLISRIIGGWLSQHLGQPFVVQSRTGAAGNIATEAVAKAAPDGYTLLTCLTANTINPSLYRKLPFNFLHDIAPVAGLIRLPMVLLVNPSFPAKTFPEFIAYARAHPGKINMASPGIGTPMSVASGLIQLQAGVKFTDVPYRGPAGAFTDLLAGRIQAFIITVSAAIGFIRTGKLRALAVTGATRLKVLPNVPTVSAFLPGFEATAWDGICAPRGTPKPIVDKLNATINTGLSDPQIKGRIDGLGGEPMPMTPEQFGLFLAAETTKWAKVVKSSGAKVN